MQYFLDGRWADAGSIPRAFGLDEAKQRRSVFTTLGIMRNVPLFLDHHLARLRHDASELGLSIPLDDQITEWLYQGLDRNILRDGVVRIAAIAADSGRGTLAISFEPPRPSTESVSLLLTELPPSEPRSIKRMWRKDWDDAVRTARDAGCTDVLVTIDGRVAETSICNLFAAFDEAVVTPQADGSLLPGIARGVLLAEGFATEAAIPVDRIARAGTVFVTNSVRGISAVNRILCADGRIIYEGEAGGHKILRRANTLWDRLVGREIALKGAAERRLQRGSGG